MSSYQWPGTGGAVTTGETNHGTLGSTATFDFSASAAHYGDLSANCAITLENMDIGNVYAALIESDGSHSVTWSGYTLQWGSDGAPDFTSLADGVCVLINFYFSGAKNEVFGSYKTF